MGKVSEKPIRRYQKGDRNSVRAQQVWLILAARAANFPSDGKLKDLLITYGELAHLMGRSPRAGRSLKDLLGAVGFFCIQNDLPALNSIVVNADTREPGDAVVLNAGRTVKQEQKDVRKTEEWLRFRPPSPRQLQSAFERGRSAPAS